jgi:hypothetical protein
LTQVWLIVRTEFAKGAETSVARQIEALGFEAWVPMDVRFHRLQAQDSKFPMPKRHVKRERIWETPLIPTYLFAMPPAGLSVSAQAVLNGVRYYHSLHTTNPLYGPAIVTADQITAFRDMVERENTIKRRQFSRKQEGKRATKTIKLDPEGAALLMQELFGLDIPIQEAA